ncbi:ABC transporter substrate-binding protein [Nocardioides solisilvae]|uniref:ABC transporter substrate-binding protein n=1 Tax=Nocardioides solisilvae TaxID=1542435 RepID=UPI000D74D09B|nr:extracellular solute-binding protein [Nocardioides solisilvae]
MSSRRPALVGALLSLALVAAGCTGDDPGPGARPDGSSTPATPQATAEPTPLTLGVYGSKQELAAWADVVEQFNVTYDSGEVTLVEWPDHDSAVEAMAGGETPDVFMAVRQDLDQLLGEELVRPVSELLDERGVDFGDDFSRDAVESFSLEGELQCMAYSVSPMVMFLNTDLVDFDKMERRGLDVSSRWDRWSLAEFEAAADFAARPARGTSGVHIDPTVRGLAPFVQSGGGAVFDDDEAPTSLSFSSDESRAALEETLAVLRDPSLTLTEEQLERRTPLQWFRRGKLGMIAGHRDLVPELRQVEGLNFNVMSMPTLEAASTVGEVTGLCLSSRTKDAAAAADLIAYAVGEDATARVAQEGAMVPANLAVAASDVFLQPGRQPGRSRVFNTAVRGMAIAPLLESWDDLERAVAPFLLQLLTEPGDLDLDAVTEAADEASREVLDPEEVESEPAEETPAPEGGE